jgi:hypothetical protein
MPSHDGFGQMWRWPLYSPRRFFSCIAVVLALIALSNMVLGSGKPKAPAAGQGTPPASSTPAPSQSSAQDSGTPTGPAGTVNPAPANGGSTPAVTPTVSPKPATPGGAQHAVQVALAFTQAWADHVKPAAQWLAAVSRYADPEFAAQLKSTDPANVPASRVTGPPSATSVFYASASVEVPTDAGVVVVQLISDGHTWRVVDIHPK